MGDISDYVRKEWAKVEAEDPGPRIRLTDLDQIGNPSRKPTAEDKPCWICGAMDHEFIMLGGQRIECCPQCPEPMLYISIPENWPLTSSVPGPSVQDISCLSSFREDTDPR